MHIDGKLVQMRDGMLEGPVSSQNSTCISDAYVKGAFNKDRSGLLWLMSNGAETFKFFSLSAADRDKSRRGVYQGTWIVTDIKTGDLDIRADAPFRYEKLCELDVKYRPSTMSINSAGIRLF